MSKTSGTEWPPAKRARAANSGVSLARSPRVDGTHLADHDHPCQALTARVVTLATTYDVVSVPSPLGRPAQPSTCRTGSLGPRGTGQPAASTRAGGTRQI